MTTFEEFITRPISNKVALLEVEPGLELTSWTLDSGYIYYAPFNETLLNESAIISQVKENGSALARKSSMAEMVQGSWYQDAEAGRLYVWCSDDGNPSAKIIIAHFTVYFATEARIFNTHYYQPRIPEGGISLTAAGDQIDSGEIALLNGDGWFDTRMTRCLWRGTSAKLLLGGDDLVHADYEKLCHLRVQGLSWEDAAVRMSIKGMKVEWRKKLPINEFYTAEEILRPNGNGNYTTWDGDYQDVDEAEADGDASCIRTDAGGLPEESFAMHNSSIPDGAKIEYLALYIRGRKEIDGDGRIRFLLRIGTMDYIKYPGNRWDTKYQTKVYVWPVNPATGSAWTRSEIDALEVGVEGDKKVEGQALRVTQVYVVVSYAVMREFDEGKPMPILYGEGELTPVLVNNQYKKGKFQVADPSVQTLKEIVWVRYEGVEIPSDKLEKNLDQCCFAIESSWSGTVEDPANVRVRVKGSKRSDIPGESSTDMITCASDILRHLCQRVLGYSAEELDLTSFSDSRSAAQPCVLFLNRLVYVEDAINWLRRSVKGIFGQNREGKVYFKLWNEDASNAIAIDCDREALEFSVLERGGPVCERAICKYRRDADTEKWLWESARDEALKYRYSQREIGAFETALASKGNAEALAYEFLQSHREPITECEVVVKLQAAKIEVGDKVKLTRSRAPYESGGWTEKVFQVKAVQREPGNRVRLLLEPNLPCLDFQLTGFEEAENPDMQDGMQRALAVFDKDNQEVKASRVVAGSIKQDEALRKDSISTVQVPANSARAVAHGQAYPVHFCVSMYSSGDQNIYELKSFNDLTDFLTGWKIVVFCTGIMPHLENDGDMEAADTNAWTAMNDALLSKANSPVHGGNKALKVEIGAGKTYGMARQEIDVTPGPSGSASVFSWRVWARNGNATSVKLIARYYDGAWKYLATDSASETGEYVELMLLRKSVPAGTTKLIIDLEVEGSAGQYGYFDDVKVSSPDSSVVIKQINGTTKDFKVRAFLEQAGS